MSFNYSDLAMLRKMRIVKTGLWNDGFYRDEILCKVITVTSSSGFFSRTAASASSTNTIIKCIAEYSPNFVTHDNVIETVDADVRLGVRTVDSHYLIEAAELWIDNVRYKIKSRRPEIYGIDDIFFLTIVGKQSV